MDGMELETELQFAYDQGYAKGWDNGYESGYMAADSYIQTENNPELVLKISTLERGINMDDNFSRVAAAEGFELIQSAGDDDTVYAQSGKFRQVWKHGQYIGQYQYAE